MDEVHVVLWQFLIPRLSLSWYSQATPGQGVVGEEQVSSYILLSAKSLNHSFIQV